MDSLLTLGRQHFSVHPQEIATEEHLLRLIGEDLDSLLGTECYAEPFFRCLGFDTVDSLDASNYESCTLVHNLNIPIPEEWHERYDVVFDGGTLEHVFHFPNAVANSMNLVKSGGVLVMMSPSNNLNGHGFYQFSPELFFRVFCEANGFRLLLIALVETSGKRRIFRVEDPNDIGRRIRFGGDGELQMAMVAVRDRVISPLSESPCQSDYSTTWSNSHKTNIRSDDEPSPTPLKWIKQWLRGVLAASWVYRYDRLRISMRDNRVRTAGVTKVTSLSECFRKSS